MTLDELRDAVRDSAPKPIWMVGQSTRVPPPGSIDPVSLVEVTAPTGIRTFTPDEMTVVCGSGTEVDELLDAVSRHGQYVNLPVRPGGSGTVGGALAVGEGDVGRLGRGSVRDVLLQADVVDGRGNAFRAGGPTVKNVSGFDLCRLLVGSCGRIGFLGDVVLRSRPKPIASQWYAIRDVSWERVSGIMETIHKPTSVLWDGEDVLVWLEGHPSDLDETRQRLETVLGRRVEDSDEPDLRDHPVQICHRLSEIADVVAESRRKIWVEVGTGVVHLSTDTVPPDQFVHPDIDDGGRALGEIEGRLLRSFDPDDRLNGGSAVWGTRHRRRLEVMS